MIEGNALWELVQASDFITKCILLVLLLMSITCWSIALYKFAVLWMRQQQLEKVSAILAHVDSMAALMACHNKLQDTAAGRHITYLLQTMNTIIGVRTMVPGLLNAKENVLLEDAVHTMLTDSMYHEEEGLGILSTCAAASPLIGLFGTVWGLIHSFVRISFKQSADIATVAPGIAEALITTLAGLIVAIPALVLFNLIVTRLRAYEHRLAILLDRCLWIIKREL